MSFDANYMLYQAAYFRSHPDSPFAILADNVKAPFNEYLWMAAQWGLVSLIFVYIIDLKRWILFKEVQLLHWGESWSPHLHHIRFIMDLQG